MKKVSGSKKKSGDVPRTVDEYLAKVPEPGRATLKKMRSFVKNAAPQGTEEVISYGMPAFRHGGVLVWFAAFADHCSLFPTAAAIEKFQKELSGYKLSKGTIQFPLNKPLPATLVKKIVKARVEQIAAKGKKKK